MLGSRGPLCAQKWSVVWGRAKGKEHVEEEPEGMVPSIRRSGGQMVFVARGQGTGQRTSSKGCRWMISSDGGGEQGRTLFAGGSRCAAIKSEGQR